MKKSYFFFILILFQCAGNLFAQGFYKETFGSGSSLPAGSTASGSWAVSGTSSSSTNPRLSGGSNLVVGDCGGAGTLNQVTITGISTVGKTSIILSYGIRKSSAAFPTGAITTEWSNDGSTWNAITIGSGGSTTWSIVSSPALPAGAEGQSNLRLRWTFTSTAAGSCASPPNFRIDDVTLGQNSVLPVTFSNTRAYKQGSGIKIDWSNLTESDIANYQVERSSDGKTFISLAQIDPTKINGERSDYNFTDASPDNGINFYRILSLETNGKKSYTAIMRVDMSNNNGGIFIYPNPVKGSQLSVQTVDIPKGQYNLAVYGTNGQQVHNQLLQVNGNTSTEVIQLPATLKSGVYNVQLNNGETRLTKTFIIQ